jgi:hypothetical protein
MIRSAPVTRLSDDLSQSAAVRNSAARELAQQQQSLERLVQARRASFNNSVALGNDGPTDDAIAEAAKKYAEDSVKLFDAEAAVKNLEGQLKTDQTVKQSDNGAPGPAGTQPTTTADEMKFGGEGTPTKRTDPTFGGLVERASDGVTLTKVMGMSAVGFIAYVAFMMTGTNRASVLVKNIKVIQDETNRNLIGAEITYDPDSVWLENDQNLPRGTADCFHPCISDSLHFVSDNGRRACLDRNDEGFDTWYTIQKVDGNTLTIEFSEISFSRLRGMSPSSGKYRFECPEGGRIQIQTSFGSQFIGGMSSITQLAIDVLEKAITTAITIAANTAGQLAGAGKNIFCSTIPLVCNSLFWILLFVFIIGGILLFSFSKSKTTQ